MESQDFVLEEALTVLKQNQMKPVQCGSHSLIRKESRLFFTQENLANNEKSNCLVSF